MRITPPNYTQTPNDLFDKWLPHLNEGELKVLLVIMRKTFGWHKVRDRISLTQLATLTGMLKETVIKAARTLQKKGIIKREVTGEAGTQVTHYELVIEEDSNNSYQSVKPTRPVGLDPLGSTDPQKKKLHKKKEEEEEKTQDMQVFASSSSANEFELQNKEAEEEAKTPVSLDDLEKLSQLLKDEFGLIITPLTLRRCKRMYGGKIMKKILFQLQKEPKDITKDKSAIFTSLCKEFSECK